MQLRTIAWDSLRRRKARLGFLLVALTLGIGTVVSLVSLSRAMNAAIGDDLDGFGANIVITPKSRLLDLAYGGAALGGLTVDAQRLTTGVLAAIRTIPNHRNVRAVAPTLVGTAEVGRTAVLLVGTIFHEEHAVKGWWRVDGRFAAQGDEVMLGAEAAVRLRKRVGDSVDLGDARRHVVGIIGPTGALEDQAIIADLPVVQRHLSLPEAISYALARSAAAILQTMKGLDVAFSRLRPSRLGRGVDHASHSTTAS